MQITFRPLASDDLPELHTWFKDAELSRRLSFPTDDWFAYVTAGADARCWVASDAGELIAMIQVDREDSERGYLDLAVRPQLRGQGIGTAVLKAFLSGPGGIYGILEGRIEPDNAASLACCRRCGFEILPELDADGLQPAIYRFLRNS
ncbi:GNAT family N-acetyltransferase [Rhizobium sp. CSW-27]|uniref:GNAT family N-acetyltransferase n=1 Tax=Rhizobium sp. CSW-27 TaxID=2839985 RepID=UPI001C00C7A5|nr:GNAT family N-acetyltransferase [Rhizobium sp. CSW-27]